MTMIETVAEIGPDRKLTVTLPEEVRQGSRRVMLVVLDDPAANDETAAGREGDLVWEGNLLVYDGPVPADLDIAKLIEQSREERMLSVLFGDGG